MKPRPGRRVHLVGLAVLFAVLAVSLAACGGSDSTSSDDSAAQASAGPEAKLYEAAKKEGSVTWYSSGGTVGMDAAAAAFEKRYPGIDVAKVRAPSGPLESRYAQERAAGSVTADLVTNSDPRFYETAKSKNWLETQLDLPALESYPKDYHGDGLATVGVLQLVVGYNKHGVPDADVPKTWKDILRPEFKGDIIFGDPRAAVIFLALAEYWRQEYGDGFLEQFAAQDLKVVPSVVPAAAQLAAGGAKLIVPASYIALDPIVKKGAPVGEQLILPTITTSYIAGVSTDAPHPNAGRLLMNFLLTKEGQTAFNSDGGASPLGDLPGTHPLPANPDDIIKLDAITPQAEKNKQKLLSLLGIE